MTTRYNTPQKGTEDWHQPLNENFEALSIDVEIRDTDANRSDHEPTDGAKYLAVDTGDVYLGDGSEWQSIGTISTDGESGGSVGADGIESGRTNVGAMVGGTYHANAYDDGGFGVAFEASDLYIDSVVVDADLSDISDSTLTIELRQYDDGATDPEIVESTTVTLTGGPERVSLGFTVPESGSADADSDDLYVLQRGPSAGDDIPLRRRFEDDGDWSESAYADQTYTDPTIDFQYGIINASSSASQPVGSWYYFFDWLVGPKQRQVASPRSTDVDEIYMRDRDPEEEFDDVSPRALWIDTS